MPVLTLVITTFVSDAAKAALFHFYKKNKDAKAAVTHWTHRKSVPVAGWFVRRYAKTSKPVSYLERKRTRMVVGGARWFVNTSTFEDCVNLFFSKFAKYKKTHKPAKPVLSGLSISLVS